MVTLGFITVSCLQGIKGNGYYKQALRHRCNLFTAFKFQKALLRSSDVKFTEKVIKDKKSAGRVEYEEISDIMIMQAREKHLKESSCTHAACPTLPPPPIPARPATQTTPTTSATRATLVLSYQQEQSEDRIYATPNFNMATRDLTPNAAQQCVLPIIQCHDNNISLTQNSAYQISKQQT